MWGLFGFGERGEEVEGKFRWRRCFPVGLRRCGKLGWLKDKEMQGVGEEHADLSAGKAINLFFI